MEKKLLNKALWYANVYQFLSDRSPQELERGYLQWQSNRSLYQKIYQSNTLPTLMRMADQVTDPERLPHGILLTFHYGPYRLLPRLLIAQGHRVALLASGAVCHREQEGYRKELLEAGLPADQLVCVPADDPMALRRIVKAVTVDKRLVLVFVDANEGQQSTGHPLHESWLEIPYGRSHFRWRTNLLRLADRFDLPIGAIQLRKACDSADWTIHQRFKLDPKMETDRAFFISKVYQELILTFQEMMQADWTAWENWALLHAYQPPTVTKALIPGQANWMIPLTVRRRAYLFDIANRQFFAIEKS